MHRARRATVEDVHRVAREMPRTTVLEGPPTVYQVSRKSFVFFRNPRPDAVDPQTGQRYDDVIVFWVGSEEDKRALVGDPDSPFFSTPHFDGHPSVLIRGCRVGELGLGARAEIVAAAWLSPAPKPVAARGLADRGLTAG